MDDCHRVYMSECLVPSRWNYFGQIRCDLAGGGMSLGVSFEVSKDLHRAQSLAAPYL